MMQNDALLHYATAEMKQGINLWVLDCQKWHQDILLMDAL